MLLPDILLILNCISTLPLSLKVPWPWVWDHLDSLPLKGWAGRREPLQGQRRVTEVGTEVLAFCFTLNLPRKAISSLFCEMGKNLENTVILEAESLNLDFQSQQTTSLFWSLWTLKPRQLHWTKKEDPQTSPRLKVTWGQELYLIQFCNPKAKTASYMCLESNKYYSKEERTKKEDVYTRKQKLRLPEISITSDIQVTPPLWQKVKKN